MKNPGQDEETEDGINEKDDSCGHQQAPATSDKPPRFEEQISACHCLPPSGTYHRRAAGFEMRRLVRCRDHRGQRVVELVRILVQREPGVAGIALLSDLLLPSVSQRRLALAVVATETAW